MQTKVLKRIWNKQQGYAFVPRRNVSGGIPWQERSFKYPSEIAALDAYVAESIAEGFDVYWCPLLFSQNSRKKEFANSHASVLWADLDAVDPKSLELTPTIAWSSSDDRYQALWLMDADTPVAEVEEINRKLTYLTGADKSGWDITQVLRIPATANYKYSPAQEGKLLWARTGSIVYQAENIKSYVETVSPIAESELDSYSIPPHIIALLNQPVVEVGTRSDKLWEIECALLEANVPLQTVLRLVKNSQWNKYVGRRDEDTRLVTELLKAEKYIKEKEVITIVSEDNRHLWAMPFETFLTSKVPTPEWLVEGIWQEGSCGMIAGEPKTYKSVLCTDLALSIASGVPFLGCIPVNKQGSVLFIQEENSASTVHDRVNKIAYSKGLGIETPFGYQLTPDLPVYFSNNFGTDLTDETSLKLIEDTVAKIRPSIIMLDPLYMMLGSGNENDASEMRAVLKWLTSLRNNYGCAVLVIHHYKKGTKQTNNRGGQNVRGSSSFHAWVESAMYLRTTDSPYMVDIEREFRSFPSSEMLRVEVAMGAPGVLQYHTQVYFGDGQTEIASPKGTVQEVAKHTPELIVDEDTLYEVEKRMIELFDSKRVVKHAPIETVAKMLNIDAVVLTKMIKKFKNSPCTLKADGSVKFG
jgi:hypothetical protein